MSCGGEGFFLSSLWRISQFVIIKTCFQKYYNFFFHSKNSYWASFLFQAVGEALVEPCVEYLSSVTVVTLCRLSKVYVDLCYDISCDHAHKKKKLVHIKSLLFICLLTDQIHCSWKYGIVIEKAKNTWINDMYVVIYCWFVCHPL